MSLRTKWILLALLAALCAFEGAANFIPQTAREASLWPDKVMRLGLDLRGGIHIVIGPDLDVAIEQELTAIKGSVERTLADDNVTGVQFVVEPQRLVVKPANEGQKEMGAVWNGVKICGVCGHEQEIGLDAEGDIVYAS